MATDSLVSGMLVLSRKEEEWIRIGDNIYVYVLEIKPGCVKLGIRAPKEIPILRGELVKDDPPETSPALVPAY